MNNQYDIYLDHASTTPTDPEVVKVILPFFTEKYGNAESLHHKGKEALIAVDKARKTIAGIWNCSPSEVIFTGSGTEANNLAILGVARANQHKGRHLITTQIEHSSVFKTFKILEKEGFEITYLAVDKYGLVNPEDLEKAINKNTTLVSIIYGHNEIGTIQPLQNLGEICQKNKVLFHSDACQAAGALTLDTKKLALNLMTINGSKIYGPKGVGALFVKRGTKIKAIMGGGQHEFGLRPGTQNTPGIIGLAKALELATDRRLQQNSQLTNLRDFLIKELTKKFPAAKLNGHSSKRLPNNISITIPEIDATQIVAKLDKSGIYISTGSACDSGSNKPSQTLTSIGLSQEQSYQTLRITLGNSTTKKDLEIFLEELKKIVN